MREMKKEVLEEPQPLETKGYQIYHIKEEDVDEDSRVDGEAKYIQENPQPEGQQVYVIKQEYLEDCHGLDDETVAKGIVEEPHSSGTEGYQIYFVKQEDFEEEAEMQISSSEKGGNPPLQNVQTGSNWQLLGDVNVRDQFRDVNHQHQNSKLDMGSNQQPSIDDKEEDESSGIESETEVGSSMSNTSQRDVRSTKPRAEIQILRQDSFIIPGPSSGMQWNAKLQTPVNSSPRESSCLVDNSGFRPIPNGGRGSEHHQEAEEDPVNIPSSYHKWGQMNRSEQSDSNIHDLQESLQYPDHDEPGTTKSDFIVHIKTDTAKTPPHSSASSGEINLSGHLRTHTQQCNQETRIADGMSTPTGERSCPYCNKIFGLKSTCNFSRHVRTHTGEKPYQCSDCCKRFARKGQLTCHIRIHTGEKPYQCVHCDKKCATQSNLSSHIRIHTREKPYQCVHCDKKFATQSSHSYHIRTHTGEQPYQCVLCNKKFAGKTDLLRHSRTHTGENPFQCAYCLKRFKQKNHLVEHIRVHTGEKPYQCVHCDKKFATHSSHSYHIRTHTGEKPHQCVRCDKKFNINLTQHITTHTRPVF